MIKRAGFFIIFILLFTQGAEAQFYFFGRNKVQYDKFDWKILRTEHFNIYYYGEMYEIAEIGAFYAEEIYDELKVKLNHVVGRKIPLIFYNTSLHFQQTNTTPGFIPEGVGGFFEFLKGRVVIPYTGALGDFKHVIRHEIVHVFMVTKVFRVLSDHREIAETLPPLWFVEGLAEYLSTEPDAQAEMVMRDAVLNNYVVGVRDMWRIYGSFLMYKEGQNFLEYVDEVYGPEKIPQIIENVWMYKDFEEVIAYTLGKPIDVIDQEWQFYLKQKYYPLLAGKVPPSNGAEKLTDWGFNFSPVYYEEEGNKYVYFNANRDGYSSVYRLKLIENEEYNTEMPDPELVIRGEKSGELEAFHLFQSGIDISKKGELAFVTKSGASDALHIYSIKEDKITDSYQRKDLITITSPKFSEDGKRVVFQSVDRKGFSDIYILDRENGEITRLTNDYYDDRDPVFGRSGDEIIFTSDRTAGRYEKQYNLFSYSISDKTFEYITYIDANSAQPVISPDGKELLFTADIDGVRNLYALDITGEGYADTIKKVSDYTTAVFYPHYIDSTEILFHAFEGFQFQLFKMNRDTLKTVQTLAMHTDSAAGIWRENYLAVSGEREDLRYEKEYTLDYAQSQVTTDPVFGTRGGAVLSLSDLFGDDNYFFLIYNTADVQSDFLKSFNVAIQRVDLSKRTNYGYGIFHFSGRRYDIRESEEYFYERSFGGFFTLNFPLSKFDRLETTVSAANSDKQIISGVIERKALLLSNSISYVWDNSLWGPSGPLDGIRARLLLGFTGDIKYSNVNYFSVIADYRQYFRLGLQTAVAVRGAMFYNEGKEARRYFMGGSWDLRGWPRWSIRGEKMWISSLEFRFPLIDQLRIQFPFIDLGFFGIRGAAFFDAGNAWDEEYRQTLGSVGGGIRFNLFGAIVLRYDIGKKIENNFTSLQPGLFYQFFFGWDF